jgi:hypothetical protein
LSIVKVTKTKDKEGELDSPVTLSKGIDNIEYAVSNTQSKVPNCVPNLATKTSKPSGEDDGEEQLDVIPKSLKLTQLQIF